jgi:hypothetical protein
VDRIAVERPLDGHPTREVGVVIVEDGEALRVDGTGREARERAVGRAALGLLGDPDDQALARRGRIQVALPRHIVTGVDDLRRSREDAALGDLHDARKGAVGDRGAKRGGRRRTDGRVAHDLVE